MILSRLLTPDDFGIVAMASVFIAFAYLIRDFGLPLAALQAPRLTRQQASNMFWLNTTLACGAALVLTLSTPIIVAIFDDPRLSKVVPAMASVIVASGIGAQIQVDLARRMRFFAIVVSDVIAQLLGLSVAIILAQAGLGYWALVTQALTGAVVTLAIRWGTCRWKPLRFRRGHGSGRLVRSATQYGLAQLLTFAQNNADTLIIGITLGATPLGYYNRAYQLLTAPAGRLLDPMTQVVIPTLSAARDDGRDYQSLLLRIQFILACTMTWVFAMISGSARVLVPLLLGPGWDATIPVLQVLAIGGVFTSLSSVSYWAFVHRGKSRELLRYNMVSKPLAIGCILFGSLYGLVGVAIGYAIAMGLSWPLNLWWLKRVAGLRAFEFARNGLMSTVSGALGGGATMVVCTVFGEVSPVGVLVGSVAVGSSVMLIALTALPKSREQLRGSLHMLRKLVTRPNDREA